MDDAIRINTGLLEAANLDLEEVLRTSFGTTMDHGSEFRNVNQLRQILGGHLTFGYLKQVFQEGMDFFLLGDPE